VLFVSFFHAIKSQKIPRLLKRRGIESDKLAGLGKKAARARAWFCKAKPGGCAAKPHSRC